MSEDFAAKLSRWSQRKQAARRGDVAADDEAEGLGRGGASSPREGPQAQGADELAARRETATADAARGPEREAPALPPVDELTADSDYTVFMAENVPGAIRRAALRKLWLSDPALANLDRLNDYDEDYSIVETVMSAVRTSYQAGKGYIDIANDATEREPAYDERTKRIAASEPRESSAELTGAASPPAAGGDEDIWEETASVPQPVHENEARRAQPVEDRG